MEKDAKENEALQMAVEMSKKIKKQRKQLPPLLTPTNNRIDLEDGLCEALNNTS